ncbi:VanZ family protein [Kitasatospora terrestris]|uniref:VanZ family protein n=1 Tax=Kitasatospora terrestris TaxID=258051 RepID=UPI0031ED2DCF
MHRHGTTARTGVPTGDRPAGPGASRPLRTTARVLLALHLLLLGWLTLRPLSVSWTYPANLTPLASVEQALATRGLAGAVQLASGLLPLAPVGVLLPLAGGRLRVSWFPSLLRTTGTAALLATGLEILGGSVPGHVLNVDDILLGTLGAALAHLALVPAVRAALLHRRGRAAHVPAAPVPVADAPADGRGRSRGRRSALPAGPAPSFTGLSPSGTSPRR